MEDTTDAHTGPDDDTQPTNDQTDDTTTPEAGVGDDQASSDDEKAETFPREYVEKLRQENGKYRQRATDRDALAHRLHTALVSATGRLADATDLPFDESHLDDADALTDAIDALLERKPHLAARRARGDVGQGITSKSDPVDLAGILRANAG